MNSTEKKILWLAILAGLIVPATGLFGIPALLVWAKHLFP